MYKIILTVFVFIFSVTVLAGESTGTITTVFVNKPNQTYGNTAGAVMFAAGVHTNKPACSTADEQWVIPIDTNVGRSMYSLLLTAAASGKTVSVYGTGVCDVWSDRETVNVILVNY